MTLSLLLPSLCLAAAVDVGTFAKAGGDQRVPHRLGASPRALLLWSEGQLAEGLNSSTPPLLSQALCDEGGCLTVSGSTAGGGATTASSRGYSAQAFTLLAPGSAVLAEASLLARDEASFTLRWAPDDGQPYLCHYLALSAPDLQAKVLPWRMPTTQPGVATVTGVGFVPELLLSLSSGESLSGVPSRGQGLNLKMAAAGADGAQWVTGTSARAGDTFNNTARWHRAGQMIMGGDYGLTPYQMGALRQMDPDGFTVDFSVLPGSPGTVLTLALRGLRAKVGALQRPAAPGLQQVSGVGFRPAAVLLRGSFTASSAAIGTDGALGLGAATAGTAASGGFSQPRGPAPISVSAYSSTADVYQELAGPSVTAQARLASLDADGFTLEWSASNAAASELGWVALAPLTDEPQPPPPEEPLRLRVALGCSSAEGLPVSPWLLLAALALGARCGRSGPGWVGRDSRSYPDFR